MEDRISDLQFENEQLHVYTDYLESKLRNIKSFLRQGVTYQKTVMELDFSAETSKHLAFLQDALCILEESVPEAPKLKSLKDLDRKPSPRRVEYLKKENNDFLSNINVRRK